MPSGSTGATVTTASCRTVTSVRPARATPASQRLEPARAEAGRARAHAAGRSHHALPRLGRRATRRSSSPPSSARSAAARTASASRTIRSRGSDSGTRSCSQVWTARVSVRICEVASADTQFGHRLVALADQLRAERRPERLAAKPASVTWKRGPRARCSICGITTTPTPSSVVQRVRRVQSARRTASAIVSSDEPTNSSGRARRGHEAGSGQRR